MGEAAFGGAFVQRAHRVGAERAETHRRNIEDRDRIRLCAFLPANGDAEMLLVHRLQGERMAQPLVTLRINVELRAQGPLVELHLGALIDDRALVAAERQTVLLALEEILAHFRPYLFEEEAQMRRDW